MINDIQNTEHSEIIVVAIYGVLSVPGVLEVKGWLEPKPTETRDWDEQKVWEDENNFQKYQRYPLSMHVHMPKGSTGTGKPSPVKADIGLGTFILYTASFNHYTIFDWRLLFLN